MLDLSNVSDENKSKFKGFHRRIHVNSAILYFPEDEKIAEDYFARDIRSKGHDVIEDELMRKYYFHVVEWLAIDHPSNQSKYNKLLRTNPKLIPPYMLK
jgi:hypothetical protein